MLTAQWKSNENYFLKDAILENIISNVELTFIFII